MSRPSAYLFVPRWMLSDPALGVEPALVWAVIRELPTDTDGWARADLENWAGNVRSMCQKLTLALCRLEAAELVTTRQSAPRGLDVRANVPRYAALCRAWEEGQVDGR